MSFRLCTRLVFRFPPVYSHFHASTLAPFRSLSAVPCRHSIQPPCPARLSALYFRLCISNPRTSGSFLCCSFVLTIIRQHQSCSGFSAYSHNHPFRLPGPACFLHGFCRSDFISQLHERLALLCLLFCSHNPALASIPNHPPANPSLQSFRVS